ncbi:MAG: hypothetical protein L6V93_12870 [Clostridiales bacterium]|nr:MAG: hypothetical protein L6V93_12870 [Clostridiales bacterium]
MRLDNLGKGYSEAEILERIIATRNGIITAAPSEIPKKSSTNAEVTLKM